VRNAALWAPGLALLAAVFALPLAEAVWTSLHQVWLQCPGEAPFVGVENFALLLASERFWAAVRHTGLFAVTSVALELTLGVGLALVMHRTRARGRALVRGAALVPWALPTVVAGLLWAWILHDRHGVANHLLVSLGAISTPLVWLGEPALAMSSIIGADVWKTTPFVALIALAGLQSIDRGVYEAGSLDGATGWRAFVHLTLPLLRPALLVALLFRTVDAVRVFVEETVHYLYPVPRELGALRVGQVNGTPIRLSDVGRLELRRGPITIDRLNRQRLVTVEAGLLGRPLGGVVSEIQRKLKDITVPAGYTVAFGDQTVTVLVKIKK